MAKDRWRSLAEAAGHIDPDAAREFPPGVDEPPAAGSLGRREALKLLGASVMLSGAAGCSRAPRGKIVPASAVTCLLDSSLAGLLTEASGLGQMT